jgi:hypothetical protein
MTGFDYIRRLRQFYRPRTPRAALLAVESGLLPVEAFVYRSSSIKSLFDEPWNPEELERALAKPDMGLGEAMLLSEIFTEMTKGRDKELALFAAESLNGLEARWSSKVEELRSQVKEGTCEDEGVCRFARALYEYALIVGRYAPIRNYYLREAYYVLTDWPEACLLPEGFDIRIRCLLRLGLFDQAEAVLQSELGRRSDGELLLLAAEAAFLRKDTRRLRELVGGRDLDSVDMPRERRELLRAWAGA